MLVALAVVSVATAYVLYQESVAESFSRALADALLQLALLVVLGALVSFLISLHAGARSSLEREREQERAQIEAERERERVQFEEERRQRLDLLRRLRAANQRVQVARRLVDAHDSARTYSVQARELIATRSEFEDVREDLRFARGLFSEQPTIEEALETIVEYLICGEEEWTKHKRAVDAAWKDVGSAADIFSSRHMQWIEEFVAGSASYLPSYEQPVLSAKQAMRKAIFTPSRNG